MREMELNPIEEAAREILYQCGLGGYGPEQPPVLLKRSMEEVEKAVRYRTAESHKEIDRLRAWIKRTADSPELNTCYHARRVRMEAAAILRGEDVPKLTKTVGE